jgi:hypothetical protein
MMNDHARQLLEVFEANPTRHGVLNGLDKNGNKNASTLEGQPVTQKIAIEHLTSKDPHQKKGWLPVTDSGTRVGCIDLDAKNYPSSTGLNDALEAIRRTLVKHNLQFLIETSTRGGIHIWVFAVEMTTPETMRLALARIVREALPGQNVEVYPMGDGPSSRWLYTPYCGASVDPQRLGYTFLVTPEGQAVPIDELSEWADLHRNANTLLEALANNAITSPPEKQLLSLTASKI